MVIVMVIACGIVGLVAWLLVRGAEDRPDYVTSRWIGSHLRDRRDDS